MTSPRTLPVSLLLTLLLNVSLIGPAQGLVILQYHHISEQTPAATSISPARFESHLELIASSGYQVLDLETVAALVRDGEAFPDKAVLITFDDSYDSIYTEARPRLQARGWPFVVFANTEPVDLGLAGFLSWQQLAELIAAGAAIANHGVTHPHMIRHEPGETQAAWRQRMRDEILGAEQRIEAKLGQSHRVFAYPYGEFNGELEALLRELDFIAMGQHSGGASAFDPQALPRFPFGGDYGGDEDFALKLRALPMPITRLQLKRETGERLVDGILPLEVKRPILELELADSRLLERMQCYVSLQGRAEKHLLGQQRLEFQAPAPLKVGRSRYNCTSPGAEPGRFHWISVPFIRRHPDGSWAEEP